MFTDIDVIPPEQLEDVLLPLFSEKIKKIMVFPEHIKTNELLSLEMNKRKKEFDHIAFRCSIYGATRDDVTRLNNILDSAINYVSKYENALNTLIEHFSKNFNNKNENCILNGDMCDFDQINYGFLFEDIAIFSPMLASNTSTGHTKKGQIKWMFGGNNENSNKN